MDRHKLDEVLRLHAAWLQGSSSGSRADLSEADLSRANLSGADLYGANLSGANLSGADLSGAHLSRANLSGANLYEADLSRANLSGANLYEANLSRANLSRANLYGANLYGANLSEANLSRANLFAFKIVPDEGAFVGWKKLRNNVIARVEIPADAARVSSLVGRKCRAQFVNVLALYGEDGAPLSPSETGMSQHDPNTVYKVGEIVRPDTFDGDIRLECTNGIHFFITRKEAERY